MTPEAQMNAGPQGSWFSRNWKWLVGLGCVLPLLCCGVFGVGTFVFVKRTVESTGAYSEALSRANASPEVQAALGSPVMPGFIPQGSVKTANGRSSAAFTVPLKGPRGEGKLVFSATEMGGKWTFHALQVVADGKTIDLMADAPAPPADADD